MSRSIRQALSAVCGLAVLCAFTTAYGCGKGEDSGASSSVGASSGKKMASAGASGGADAIFETNCANCHMMSGKGRGRMDLSHLGGQGKTSDWIAAHIKNPKAHNPGSKMPAFEGKLAEADIKSLADHLASLK